MSNITNLNRDYLIKINVKEATIDVPKMTFWNTDKKTSNMFVQLVINMSTNELISQYVTVQNATDYKITLNVIKPKTKQYKTIEATLLNEEKALFEIDLTSEFIDQVGNYNFEFEVSSKVDNNDESITTSSSTYEVKGSILTNLNEEISSSPDLPILKQLIEQVKSLQGGDLTGYQKKNDAAQKTIVEDGKLYLTKLDGTKLDDGTTLPTGSGTSIDDTNTTTDKTWSSSKIDSQFKDIANKTIVENNKLYLVKPDGTKLDDGTDLPTSSGEKGDPGTSVTISSVVESAEDGGNNVVTFSDGSVLNVKNGNKGDSGTGGNSVPVFYKTEFLGELYAQPGGNNYVAWCPGDLRYDKKLDKYVMLAFCADKHGNATVKCIYQIVIDPYTFESTEPVKIKFLDSDGVTDITPTMVGTCCYKILNDGTYFMIRDINNVYYKFTSTDNGVTWIKQSTTTGYSYNPWNIFELQNGRLIITIDKKNKGFYYSDDKGVTWTNIIPSGTPGDYNAEGYILELGNNKLMCIARKNMQGSGGYDPNATNYSGPSDHAIISYSTDNGTTWSAWQESTTIDNMNASNCTAIVHDGVVEIFACSRWYYTNETYVNSDYTNTGKCGAITHYTATIENALNDNFTNNGIIIYSNADPSVKQSSRDFHSPCVALDKDENMLLVYFDRINNGTEEKTNHFFIRGSLYGLNYKPLDNISSKFFPYTGLKIDNKLNSLEARIIQKVNDAIKNGGTITPDTPGVYVYTTDGLILDYDLLDDSKCDTTTMKVVDKTSGIEAYYRQGDNSKRDLVTTFPSIVNNYRDSNNFTNNFVINKNQVVFDYDKPITFEINAYITAVNDGKYFLLFYNNGGSSTRFYERAQPLYAKNTSGYDYNAVTVCDFSPLLNNFCQYVVQLDVDGSYKVWINNELKQEVSAKSDFSTWDKRMSTADFFSRQNLMSIRFYNKALTDEERTNNYMYEKTRYES